MNISEDLLKHLNKIVTTIQQRGFTPPYVLLCNDTEIVDCLSGKVAKLECHYDAFIPRTKRDDGKIETELYVVPREYFDAFDK